ncbi:MAG: ribosomal protein L7/L12 [Muribaculaceae bacterium]
MSVVLYINKLGDDSIAIIGTMRRYFDLSFFEASDLLEQELPIELPPLDDPYVDAFISEMGQVQSNIDRSPGLTTENIIEIATGAFENVFGQDGQAPSQGAKPTKSGDSAPFATQEPTTDLSDSAPFARQEPTTDLSDSAPFARQEPTTDLSDQAGKFTVRITNAGPAKLAIVKFVKEQLNCSLAKAKDMVDNGVIPLECSRQEADEFIKELSSLGCRASLSTASATKPQTSGEVLCPCGSGKPFSQCHGRSASSQSASGKVSIEIVKVGSPAFKMLGIITKAYGISYSEAGAYLRNGAKLPELPASEAAKVADQLRAIGSEVRY